MQVFDVIAAAVGGRIELEVDLVHPVDEMHGQAVSVAPGPEALRESGGKPHLEKPAFSLAGSVVQPAEGDAEVFGDLDARLPEFLGEGIGGKELAGADQRHDVHILRGARDHPREDQRRAAADDDLDRLGAVVG
jgi:hypothetical protein